MTTTTVDLPAFTLRGIARTFNTETRHQIPNYGTNLGRVCPRCLVMIRKHSTVHV
ncbi:MAG: hypothetical protein IPF79_05940 [Ignavibacteria bacterium]|nr:hypothetical protein [Ignavibacteria bacterium]